MAIAELPDEQLLYWVTNQWIKRDGEIVFRNKTTSAPLKINFKNAYCVNFLHTVSSSRGTSVSLTISPEIIDLNGIFLDNNWSE
ncbi:type VI secretion system tube protein TssD [Capnocytophaga cynodegmi]|uniref:type VI secretion system tube protein TssD n=1 Tax=Capnocytophaga cynodegmi TaxID=28189 RepID=UPI0034DAC13E